MYNTESRRFLGKKKPTEKSVEDFHSNSDTQTVVSQTHLNVVECESLLTSINNENNHRVASIVEKTEGKQTEKYVNNRTISNINKTIQNHSKVKFPFFLYYYYFFMFITSAFFIFDDYINQFLCSRKLLF